MRFVTTSAFAIALAASLPAAATAQNYPSRTVTVVVPFPAGGSVDGVARILVQKLNETVGQHFIVENRAGRKRHHHRDRAGGIILRRRGGR